MSEDKIKSKRKIRNDIIFVATLLCVIGIAIVCMLIFRVEGDTVDVSIDGNAYGKYSLSENRTVEIKTDRGTNILVIENGKTYVKSASCPDGICSSHRPISYSGESIICLPNKVVITVTRQDQSGPDVVI